MKIYEKISVLQATIKEIKNITQNLNNDSELKISQLNEEILRLKEGISENVEVLEKILEEKNARS
tara:strand:- start:105 stop:299 length:195 start_codon:yes stop_codon:yes gene_type:complete